jgi:hypothetical protein
MKASAVRIGLFTIVVLVASGCLGDRSSDPSSRRPAEAEQDSAFAGIQARGEHAMGVDQNTSTHVFEPLPDGGRIRLQRNTNDSAGTEQIRRHMQHIAMAFRSGDFSLPGYVHALEVPGTAVMSAKREAITYTVEALPRGAALRLESTDSAAILAIHQFLAFQRADHHAAAHPS